jgi:hypothetical protein
VLLTEFTSAMSISPDGRSVAYCAPDTSNKFAVWIRSLDSQQSTRLAEVPGLQSVIWSPDSRSLALLPLLQRDQPLTTIKLGESHGDADHHGGEQPGRQLGEPGKHHLQFRNPGPISRVAATGGAPVQVTWLDSTRKEAGHRFPCFPAGWENTSYS